MLVQGVEGSDGGLGYFGFSYYEQNADKLNLVAVDDGSGKCVEAERPRRSRTARYKPLSRPLFMYPNEKSLAKAQVKGFMDYVLANYDSIAKSSQIVPMTADQAAKGKKELQTAEANAG